MKLGVAQLVRGVVRELAPGVHLGLVLDDPVQEGLVVLELPRLEGIEAGGIRDVREDLPVLVHVGELVVDEGIGLAFTLLALLMGSGT